MIIHKEQRIGKTKIKITACGKRKYENASTRWENVTCQSCLRRK